MTKAPPVEELFPELADYSLGDFATIGTNRPVLMIAMTARTGSSYLCSGLASVLPVGRPAEIFNARHTLVWLKKHTNSETFGEFLQGYFEESDDIIIFKTNWLDFSYFSDKIDILFPNLKIIYLNRLDIEAQAVSLHKAVVTGRWHNSPTIHVKTTPSDEEINSQFDLAHVCRIIRDLNREKSAWENFFFSRNLVPARINYENFRDDLSAAISYITSHIGYSSVSMENLTSDFKVVSDQINDEWVKKVKHYRDGDFYRRFQRGEVRPPQPGLVTESK